jgi:predicted transcriptional regulator of viral defense system
MRSIDSKSNFSGLETASRTRLAKVLRATQGTITPESAAAALADTRLAASRQLARWAEQGWLQRVRRGIYVPVPLESERADAAPEDAWLIANTAFAPCFIAGWSAVEHWALTEQVFRSVCVATSGRPRHREQTIGGTVFALHTVPAAHFFGLKAVWRGATRVQVSDPSRTVLDLLATPAWGGGIRTVVDVLQAYLKSEHRNLPLLLDYAARLGNGAVFKRMGYLLQRHAPDEAQAIAACADQLTAGYTKLDPALPSVRLVTAWGLWVPAGW